MTFEITLTHSRLTHSLKKRLSRSFLVGFRRLVKTNYLARAFCYLSSVRRNQAEYPREGQVATGPERNLLIVHTKYFNAPVASGCVKLCLHYRKVFLGQTALRWRFDLLYLAGHKPMYSGDTSQLL